MQSDTNRPAPASTSLNDQQLIERYKAGDKAVFEILIGLYWPKVYGRAWQLLRSHEDAEEIAQDTFMRAERSLDTFRGECSFSTWVYHIVTNLSRNRYWYWHRRKKQQSMSIDATLNEDTGFTLSDVLSSADPDPSEIASREEWKLNLRKFAQQLPEGQREALRLRLLENKTYDEIAEIMHISLGTVKSRINRGREILERLSARQY